MGRPSFPVPTHGTYGVVFQITPDGAYAILHGFFIDGAQGAQPVAGLIQGRDGALYGTTQAGGSSVTSSSTGDGTVFRITLDGTFTLLHSFDFSRTGAGGYMPTSSLVEGSDGNLDGVAATMESAWSID